MPRDLKEAVNLLLDREEAKLRLIQFRDLGAHHPGHPGRGFVEDIDDPGAMATMLVAASSYASSRDGDRSLIPPALDRMLAIADRWRNTRPDRISELFDLLDPAMLLRCVGQTLLAWTMKMPFSSVEFRSGSRGRFLSRFIQDMRARGTPDLVIDRIRRAFEDSDGDASGSGSRT
jgi:hypothetical protein